MWIWFLFYNHMNRLIIQSGSLLKITYLDPGRNLLQHTSLVRSQCEWSEAMQGVHVSRVVAIKMTKHERA